MIAEEIPDWQDPGSDPFPPTVIESSNTTPDVKTEPSQETLPQETMPQHPAQASFESAPLSLHGSPGQ